MSLFQSIYRIAQRFHASWSDCASGLIVIGHAAGMRL